ncbi:hypothetical protein [Actinoplanes sp. M2I2]|uniref:hypothetical protein n=1 Tax=Actinoplanes sp. M2I2 TaxID=1734444 RepID=UPI0020220D47|nr:hypothetical protein [Actinoplanes sp. M2I2]
MTAPPQTQPPPSRRRWWLVAAVAAWIVVVGVLAVWSVGHERASVPEQRDIGLAVADLQRATGVVYAAASGDDQAVVLGELQLSPDCRITPVRRGLAAARTVTVYVGGGAAAGEAVEALATRLPAAYLVDVGRSNGGTKVSLHADAGDFVGIDMSGLSGEKVFTLRLTTGCRPIDGDAPSGDDPSGVPAPALLDTVVTALGGSPREPEGRTVQCPSGRLAGSWTVSRVTRPADVAGKIRGVEVVKADNQMWVYRSGGDSVVVLPEGDGLDVTVSTPCQ